MKKITIIFTYLILSISTIAKGNFFIGGTGEISYIDNFVLTLEPQVGYEFNDRWAIGTGIGFGVVANSVAKVFSVIEPYGRFNAWNNNLVYFDIKAKAGFGLNDELIACQIGLTPSLRFRINEHWDVSADIGLFGAQHTHEKWSPAVGISGTNTGLWIAYRF